ncbi:MAG: LPXTG cell wall anchor domain-containing protein [Actinomycetota bacterium]
MNLGLATGAVADDEEPPADDVEVVEVVEKDGPELPDAAKGGKKTDPADEPTEPADEPTEPADEPTEPADEPTEPADEPTEPAEDEAEAEATEPQPEATLMARQPDQGPAPKVYVCKFVGTPDVNERLQTGQNPIEVSSNAIPDWDGEGAPPVGYEFADEQGRSVVIGTVPMDPEPTILDCVGPTIDKSVVPEFTRTYLWEIDKTVVDDVTDLDPGEKAIFDYTITVTPDGYMDADLMLSGSITLNNPFDVAIDGVVTDDFEGITCDVEDDGVIDDLASGAEIDLGYECDLTGFEPGEDDMNVASVTWTIPRGQGQGGGNPIVVSQGVFVDVAFTTPTTEVNEIVTVMDDTVQDDDDAVVLGTATWNVEGTPTVFDYHVEGWNMTPGCYDVDNTAWIVETKQEASAQADYCVVAPPDEPEKPELPETGAASLPLLGLGLLSLLGGGTLLGVRRRM